MATQCKCTWLRYVRGSPPGGAAHAGGECLPEADGDLRHQQVGVARQGVGGVQHKGHLRCQQLLLRGAINRQQHHTPQPSDTTSYQPQPSDTTSDTQPQPSVTTSDTASAL
eukprot:3985566-Pyramimonas_sp.AAC.1